MHIQNPVKHLRQNKRSEYVSEGSAISTLYMMMHILIGSAIKRSTDCTTSTTSGQTDTKSDQTSTMIRQVN